MHTAQLLNYYPRNARIDEFVDSAIIVAERPTASRQFTTDIIRQRTIKKTDNFKSISSSSSYSATNDISSDDKPKNIRFRRRNSGNLRQFRFLEIFHRLCYYGIYLWWFIFGILAVRKTLNATTAVYYVKQHSHTVSEEVLANSPAFRQLLWSLDHEFQKPPAIFLLNQHALNMTFNFLCNTRDMNGVHE
ncbi:unnamed protein product, partial [Onchocerca ochengi]|uniref:Uncharacterized protein n=1 Tax=Onchocerca ochengi TaxID=42157 RepID=A0A182ELW1_ONCOC